jgi:acyl dehydratase
MPQTVIANLAALLPRVGTELAVSDWMEVTQERIGLFANATDDHQWIHVDAARAKAESPFGGPVAHGYLTLSLIVPLMEQAVAIRSARMAVNYGLNRARFVSPVPAGSRVRARATLLAAEPLPGGAQLTWQVTVEREGADKPACVAEVLGRMYE